jgi:glycosyltransferase involved in cell wall biosynthesis
MRITFFIQDIGFGGVLRQVSLLAENLKRRGHEISVVGFYPKDSYWQYLWNAAPVTIETLFSRKPFEDLPGPITIITAVSRLRNFMKKQETEILYSFAGSAALLVSWLAVVTLPETKLVWGFRGSSRRYKLNSGDIHYKSSFNVLRWISPFVPMAIANSDAGLSFRQSMGYNFAKQVVINNGFDSANFRPDAEARSRQRQEWGVPENEILIGIVGRVVHAKGFHLFLQAASVIHKARSDLRYVCVGDGEEAYKKSLEQSSRELGLSDRLIWAGFKKDMRSVFNALDVLCSASYGEGCPNVVGEAMACGVPCVVTNVGASAEIVGDLGIVVPSGDPKMLADGLLAMIEKLPEIEPERLRSRIVENFSIEIMVDKTEKALENLFRGK